MRIPLFCITLPVVAAAACDTFSPNSWMDGRFEAPDLEGGSVSFDFHSQDDSFMVGGGVGVVTVGNASETSRTDPHALILFSGSVWNVDAPEGSGIEFLSLELNIPAGFPHAGPTGPGALQQMNFRPSGIGVVDPGLVLTFEDAVFEGRRDSLVVVRGTAEGDVIHDARFEFRSVPFRGATSFRLVGDAPSEIRTDRTVGEPADFAFIEDTCPTSLKAEIFQEVQPEFTPAAFGDGGTLRFGDAPHTLDCVVTVPKYNNGDPSFLMCGGEVHKDIDGCAWKMVIVIGADGDSPAMAGFGSCGDEKRYCNTVGG